ncbi:hypothetical protein Leryth_024213 [Lithospermum erythrorhizon]|nr:hypothetical protein Leryth_024213 [Lithospermum erythrorhizon]
MDNESGNYSNKPDIDSVVVSSSLNRSSMNSRRKTESNYEEDCSANTFKAHRAGIDGNTVSEVQNADSESSVSIHQQLIAANTIVDSENPFPLNECKTLSESRSFQKSPQQLQLEICSSNSPANTEVPSAGSSTTPGKACSGELILCNVSGQIMYSGPVTTSGSTSMRSESSTTSARSFAFPVLQAEWNSSPVKMGNANRRRLRKKHGSWKRGILCCRF